MKNKRFLTVFLLVTLLSCFLMAGSAYADFDEAPGEASITGTAEPADENTAAAETPGEVNRPSAQEPEDRNPVEEQKLPGTEATADIEKAEETADAKEAAEDTPARDAGFSEAVPENAADAETAPDGTDTESPLEEPNYVIRISDVSGGTTYIKGAAQTAVPDILAGLGYELGEDAVITYDPESVDTDVIRVFENEDGILMLGNGKPFDRAARNLVLYVNGVAVELEVTDDTEISADTGSITGSGSGASPDAYILTKDVRLNKAIVIKSGDVKIDLNGHVLDASGITDTDNQGAIRVMEGARLIIVDSSPDAKHSGGEYDALPDGGVIYGGKGFTYENGNNKKRMGGGILNEGNLQMGEYQAGDVEISGGTVYMCSVTGDAGITTCGGGIANHYGMLYLRNTVIDSCTASGGNVNEGGGVWDDGFETAEGTVPTVNSVLTNVTIRNCSALESGGVACGGGFFWSGHDDKDRAMLNNLTVEGCTSGNGGGLFLAYTSNLNSLTIRNCSASENGGGIFAENQRGADGGEIVFPEDVTTAIENCSASSKGGGLYSNNGNIVINGSLSLTGCSTTGTDGEGQYLYFVTSGPYCKETIRGTITITTGAGTAPSTDNSVEIASGTKEYSLSLLLSPDNNITPLLTSTDGYTLTCLYDSDNNINKMLLEKVNEDDAVAWIGNVGYRTIQGAATAAADGDEILITADTSENIQIASGKNITINLNGHVLTDKDETKPVITNSGTLTVTGGQINANSTGIANSSGATVNVSGNNTAITCTGTAIDNSGILNVSGGSVGSADGNIGIKNQGNGRTYITGGQISADTNAIYNAQSAVVSVGGNNTTVHAADGAAIYNEGTLSVSGGDVSGGSAAGVLNTGSATLSGGSVTGNTGIMNSGTGTVTVNGTCVVNGNTAIINSGFPGNDVYGLTIGGSAVVTGQTIGVKNTGSGNVYINGGTVSGTGDGAAGILNESSHDVKIDGGTVEGETAVENEGNGAVAISGGNFDGVQTSLRNSGTGKFLISGGLFDRKSPASPIELTDGDIFIDPHVSEEYLASIKNILSDDYVVTDTKYPGSCNVVPTMAVVDNTKAGTVTDIESIISSDGEHDIVLKDDLNAAATIAITGSTTVNIDLNGHVISGNGTDSTLSVGKDATVNISDSSPDASGGINGKGAAAVTVNGGSAVIEGGTFFGALENNDGTLTVYAGNFDADPGNFVPDGYHMEYDSAFNMYRVTKNAVPVPGITVVVEPVDESALNEAQRSSVDATVSGKGKLVAVLDIYLSGDKERANVNPEATFNFKIDKENLKGHEPSEIRVYLVKEDGTLVEVGFEPDEDGNLFINHGKLGKYIIVYF